MTLLQTAVKNTILHSRIMAQAVGNLPLTLANEGRSVQQSGIWTGSSLSTSVFRTLSVCGIG